MLDINKLFQDNKVVTAPMASISNTSYRKILKDMGAGLIFAEMVSDKALVYNDKKTLSLLKMTDYERPIAQQIFGNDVESFKKAALIVEKKMKPDLIDINMGCPVPKIAVKSQAGASLLKDKDKVFEIVSAVVKAVKTPVSVKIRSGWDFDNINADVIAKEIEKAGACLITVHGRTRSQGYSGKVDLDVIKKVKESVDIPVIGNGDILSYKDADYMLRYTKCDAVMIGRGTLGNPWLIKEVNEYLKFGIKPESIKPIDKIKMLKKHYTYLLEDVDERQANLEIRTHAIHYIKGLKNSAQIRNEITKTKDTKEIFNILNNYIKELEKEENN